MTPALNSGAPRVPSRPSGNRALPVVLAGLATAVAIALLVTVVVARQGPAAQPVTPPPETVTPTPTPSPVVTPSATGPGPTPTLTAPRPGASQTPTPAAGPGALPETSLQPLPTASARPGWDNLRANPIYDISAPQLTDCPAPRTISTDAEFRAAVTAQWKCVHRAWVPVLQELGLPTVEPEVKVFAGQGTKSECGYLRAPAFYCPMGDGVVYFGGDHQKMASRWSLSVNEMVNHEYAHHLQSLTGITRDKAALPLTADLERRSELQAVCFSAMATASNSSVVFNQTALNSWLRRLRTMTEDELHGNRDSLVFWGTRGLYATTLEDCNTWIVPSEKVA